MKKVFLTLLAAGSLYAQDARIEVAYPKDFKAETLANMRGHLSALNQIMVALSEGKIEDAGKIASKQLGTASMGKQDMAKSMKYMPKTMAKMGYMLHKSASDFAQLASLSDKEDMPDLLKAYAGITAKCVACHSSYRLK